MRDPAHVADLVKLSLASVPVGVDNEIPAAGPVLLVRHLNRFAQPLNATRRVPVQPGRVRIVFSVIGGHIFPLANLLISLSEPAHT